MMANQPETLVVRNREEEAVVRRLVWRRLWPLMAAACGTALMLVAAVDHAQAAKSAGAKGSAASTAKSTASAVRKPRPRPFPKPLPCPTWPKDRPTPCPSVQR